MKNLKYAFHGLSTNLLMTIIIIIQITTAFFFLNNSINSKLKLKEDGDRILKIFDNKEPFRFQPAISNEVINKMENEEIDTGNVKKLYHYIKYNKNFIFTNFDSDYIEVDNFKGDAKFLNDMHVNPENPSCSSIKGFYIDYNFTKLFNLKVTEGSFFKKEDFEYEENANPTKIIPLILGANYKGIYKIGDELNIRPFRYSKATKAKVIGFLEKDYYFIDNIFMATVENLNNRIIIPHSSILDRTPDFGHCLASISNGVLFAENKDKALAYFNEINEEASKYTLFKFEYRGLREIFNDSFVNGLKEPIKMLNIMFLLVLIFCSTGIITSLLSFIRKHMSEFGVHLLCGAKLSDIALRITLQISIIIGVSFSFITLFNAFYFKNLRSTPYLFLFSILAILLLSIIPVYKIFKLNVDTIIRRKE
ncbi:hypothetical protein [Hathewaya massiliensis]|uniref:hypothetical protein n=1 Tax=Hathewaya massiliensis TaxID=1964382 RepID=UPI00115AA6D4|nr:hypothetical protein [Hathewaya massiliensis]